MNQKDFCNCVPTCEKCGKEIEAIDREDIPYLPAKGSLRVCLGWLGFDKVDEVEGAPKPDEVEVTWGWVVGVSSRGGESCVAYLTDDGYVGDARHQGTHGLEHIHIFEDLEDTDLDRIESRVRSRIVATAKERQKNRRPRQAG